MIYLQECIIVCLIRCFAHGDGSLIIIDFEDDVFRAFAKLEFLEDFRAGGINSNARAGLLLAHYGGGIPFEVKQGTSSNNFVSNFKVEGTSNQQLKWGRLSQGK